MAESVVRWIFRGAVALTAAVGIVLVLDGLFPPPLARLSDLSVTVVDRAGVPLRVFTTRAGTWRLPAEGVAPLYLDVLLAYEDRRFYRHCGVDGWAVARALVQRIRGGRVVSGASTLTMQVARLLEPHRRSVPGKLLEMVRALQLEARYDKRAILDMYLTLAPFGGALEGVQVAAWAWFGTQPKALNPAEAALLVALPQAPGRLRPDRAPELARHARDKVLARAVAVGALSQRLATEAMSEPLPTRRHAFADLAPHLTEALRQHHPGALRIVSTLDGKLQGQVEALARQVLPTLVEHGGLALLVADSRSRTVLAAVGAPDAHDDDRNGWVDMTRAVRSPGSALKPFIYGLGFDDRVIHPETVIADVSTRFGDYAPSNFDRGFHGELTVREALQQSLNVPAVLVLDRVGPARFAERLRNAGSRLVFPRGVTVPGLPIALGGVSITLWDITTLYVGLANGGEVWPLQAELGAAPEAASRRLMSPEAAWQIRQILKGSPPPPGLVPAGEVSLRPAIAFKTGTSYGFRDAWAFGIGDRHTVGVWVGRPDGTPSPDRYGRNTAAPLLFRVFDVLNEEGVSAESGTVGSRLPLRPPSLLRRIEAGDPDRRPLALTSPDRLRLVFPTSGLVLDREVDGDGAAPILLSATGGKRPLTWVVNDRPLPVTASGREVSWMPDGPGFNRVTVIDAAGIAASVEFRVR